MISSSVLVHTKGDGLSFQWRTQVSIVVLNAATLLCEVSLSAFLVS